MKNITDIKSLSEFYDYMWIGASEDGYTFTVSARCHKIVYKDKLYETGGVDFGMAKDLDTARKIAEAVIRERGGGFKYGIRLSEEAINLQCWIDEVALKALAAEEEQREQARQMAMAEAQAYFDAFGDVIPRSMIEEYADYYS